MDELIFMVVLGSIVLITIPILVIVSLSKISNLKQRVTKLEERAQRQAHTLEELWHEQAQMRDRNAFPSSPLTPAEEASHAGGQGEQAAQAPIPEQAFASNEQALATGASTVVATSRQQTQEKEAAETGEESLEQRQHVSEWAQTASTAQSQRMARNARRTATKKAERSDFADSLLTKVKEWFSTGNVPVKIGVLVLFAGVAALLKYVSDQGWINFPMEMRLVTVAVMATGAFVFAWTKRIQHRMFSLSLQGGAIGVLLLTTFAAFRLYGFIPSPLAFGITVLLIAFIGVLAVAQDAMILAIFAVLAGFLAPIWLSSNSGNHVALFSYYAVLNAGIFAMAWWRSWRYLNLLGFAFTFGIGLFWGVLKYSPEKFITTEPFLLLFFAFYLLIPILYARKFQGDRRDLVDAALVFGTPLIAFSIQACLLQDNRYMLAANAFGLGIIYAGLAYVLRLKDKFKELTPAYTALAAGFATLAVPLAFSAQATSCIYALEGVALVWWGLRSARISVQLSGLGLQVLATCAFIYKLSTTGMPISDLPIVNGTFLTYLIMAGALLFSALCYKRQSDARVALYVRARGVELSTVLYFWGLAWWCVAGVHEIDRFIHWPDRANALLIFAIFTGWLAALCLQRLPAKSLCLTVLVALAMPSLHWLTAFGGHNNPFSGSGWLVWLCFAVLGAHGIYSIRHYSSKMVSFVQFVWWCTWVVVLTHALRYWGWNQSLSASWRGVLVILPTALLLALSLWRWALIRLPLGARFDVLRNELQVLLFAVAGVWWVWALSFSGTTPPLPWLPIINPVELVQIALIGMAWYWLHSQNTQKWLTPNHQIKLLVALGFLMVNIIVLRTVHHWGGVDWTPSLLADNLTQTSLSVVWSILGVTAWIQGSRKGRRALWWAGAILMGIVLVKLLLIDRQNLLNEWGIISFIAYGLLCVVVGYFAPAPPREVLQHANDIKPEKNGKNNFI